MSRNRRPGRSAQPTPPANDLPEWRIFLQKHALWIGGTLLLAYVLSFFSRPLPDLRDTNDPDRQIYRWTLVDLLVRTSPASYWDGWTDGGADLNVVRDRLPILGLALGITLLSWGFGRLALSALGLRRVLSRCEIEVLSLAVGWQIHSLLVLVIGLLGGLSPTPFIIAYAVVLSVLAGAALAARRAVERRESIPSSSESDADHDIKSQRAAVDLDDSLDHATFHAVVRRISLLACLTFGLVAVGGSMLPPSDFDVRSYHLQIPKEWYQQGRINFVPHNVYGNMPLGSELHSVAAMIFSPSEPRWWWGANAGKTVMSFYALATAVLLFAAGRRVHSATAGSAAAVVYLSIPWTIKGANVGWNENAFGLYLLATIYLVYLSLTRRRQPSSIEDWKLIGLAGFLAGAAISVKYPAVLFAAPAASLLLLTAPWLSKQQWWLGKSNQGKSAINRRRSGGEKGRSVSSAESIAASTSSTLHWLALAIFVAVMLLSCGLWFAKNVAQSGNPTYPLLGELFGSRTEAQNEQWQRAHRVTDAGGFGPTRLVNDLDGALISSQWLSPLLIPLALIGWIVSRDRPLRISMGFTLVLMIVGWWLLTHRLERFLVPAYSILALMAGIGVAGVATLGWRSIVAILLAIGLGSSLLIAIAPQGVLGDHRFLASRQELESPRTAIDLVHRQIDASLGPGEAVLLVGDAAPFDLRGRVFYNTCFDDCVLEKLTRDLNPTQQLEAFHDRNITLVFVSWSELARYRSPGNYGYSDYVTPEVVDQLVADGVLEPMTTSISPEIGELFRVRQSNDLLGVGAPD